MRKLLAVMPVYSHYHPDYQVTAARSFEEAKDLLRLAEQAGKPFDSLDLPVSDEKQFWSFLDWMRLTGRNYPFSVFGCKNTPHFWQLCEKCRSLGFHFNT